MTRAYLEGWARHLRSLAGEAPPLGARLGAGPLDVPLLAGLHGAAAPPAPADLDRLPPEAKLWWAHFESAPRRQALVEEVLGDAESGPLLAEGPGEAIEVWTESELSALHALAKLAKRTHGEPVSGGARWLRRLAEARRWHVEHTQPDNATARPWALHVFLADESPESRLYAETLLHNALVSGPRPTPLIAAILLDAANEIERLAAR